MIVMANNNYLRGLAVMLIGLILSIGFYYDLWWNVLTVIIPQYWNRSPIMFIIIALISIIGRAMMDNARERQYWQEFDERYARLKKSAMESALEQMNKCVNEKKE